MSEIIKRVGLALALGACTSGSLLIMRALQRSSPPRQAPPIPATSLAPKAAAPPVTPSHAPVVSLAIPDGKRAVAVPVNEVAGVSGFVRPGSVVDVIATWELDGTPRSQLILQHLTVLAVGQDPIPTSRARPATTVTLAVSPAEAEKLVLASDRGLLRLALRPPEEKTRIQTSGTTPASLQGAGSKAAPPSDPAHLARPATPVTRSTPARAPAPPEEAPILIMRGTPSTPNGY